MDHQFSLTPIFVSGVVVSKHGDSNIREFQKPVTDSIALHESFLRYCRALWLELHTKEDPTPEWFETWIARVPNFGCGCRSWLRDYLKTNPPRYDDWYDWTVALHNAVNLKRGVPVWTAHE